MDFRPVVAPSIRELFIQQVEGAILSGQLKPGDRLPTERELADTMHISKTVVHEGLRELHRLGFLDIASRRGVTVADYAQTGSLETLMAIMDYHGGLPDEKTARSILLLEMFTYPWFQSRGQWGARGYENIAPGDAIFFDWDGDGSADHVGLVIGTDGERVYTVEGNSGDACKIKSYDLNYQCIKGYGLMNW